MEAASFFLFCLEGLESISQTRGLCVTPWSGYVTSSIRARLSVEPLLNELPQTQQQIFGESAGLTSLLESPSQIPLLLATTERLATAFVAKANNNCLSFNFLLLDALNSLLCEQSCYFEMQATLVDLCPSASVWLIMLLKSHE